MKNGCLIFVLFILVLLVIEWIGIKAFLVFILILIVVIIFIVVLNHDSQVKTINSRSDSINEANGLEPNVNNTSQIPISSSQEKYKVLPEANSHHETYLLRGSSFATGGRFYRCSSNDIKYSLTSFGATIHSNLMKDTDYLIQGYTKSFEKLKRAEEIRFKYGKLVILNEDEFIQFMKELKDS